MDHVAGGTKEYPAIIERFACALIRLREDKAPVSWDERPIGELRECDNIGIPIPEPYVVVDIDDAVQAEKLTRLLGEENISCQIMQTTRGRHFWFTAAEPVKNTVKSTTGIGVIADYRSWGKRSEVCIKYRGEWREWLTNVPWEDVAELPRWLRPLRQNKWRFYEMGDGDGRNQALFEYQIELSKRGYSHDEGADVLRMINKYIFAEPLPEGELQTVSREEAYPEPKDDTDYGAPWFGERGKFLHNVMGDILMKEINIITYNQRLYVYKDGYYQFSDNDILQYITGLYPQSTKRQREEVMDYLRIQTHIDAPNHDEYTVNLKNGRYDLRTMELLEHTADVTDMQQINAIFDPHAYCEPLEAMMQKVCCRDYQLYKLFEEMLGYCLVKNCRRQTIFIFVGEGSNGKSTVLRMLRHFFGTNNYASLSLQDLETTFRPADLENKLVNIGDDIPPTQIKDSSILKKLSRGEALTVERKNKNPFALVNYAKLIFSTNKIPPVNDKSYGFYRTLTLVPFDAVFSAADPDYNPNIEDDVTSPLAMSYLLNMAIRGYRRLYKCGFTRPARVAAAVDNYRIESSHALKWVDEAGFSVDDLTKKSTGELYYDFKNWCEEEGMREIPKQQTFTNDIKKYYGMEISKQQRDSKTGKRERFLAKASVTA